MIEGEREIRESRGGLGGGRRRFSIESAYLIVLFWLGNQGIVDVIVI